MYIHVLYIDLSLQDQSEYMIIITRFNSIHGLISTN